MQKQIYEAIAITNAGKVRSKNEDSFLLGKKVCSFKKEKTKTCRFSDKLFACVSDGMGGLTSGEIASSLVVNELLIKEKYLIHENLSFKSVEKTVAQINKTVCAYASDNNVNTGATLALFCFYKEKTLIANIGDSRVYKLSENKFVQLTQDHTREQTFLAAGLNENSKNAAKSKHILTQHIGISPEEMVIEPYMARETPKASDLYLICSDGLCGMLSDSEIEKILLTQNSIKAKARNLVNKALLNGGTDNITVILIKF